MQVTWKTQIFKMNSFDSNDFPLVSIGIPVYNSESTLAATIESALAQDYTNLEILLSDNASVDDSIKICREYARRDSRIKLFEQPENIGAGANFVFVLNQAKGEYFKWLASDDVISMNSLSLSVANLQENQRNTSCSTPHLFDFESRTNAQPVTFWLDGSEFSRIKSFFRLPGRSHGLFYSLIKRDLLTSFPLLSSEFFAWDWCLVLYLLSKGPMGVAQNSYLISGTNGISSTTSIYTYYGLTGRKRILPFQKFTLGVLKTSSNWSTLGRLLLISNLISLNLKNLFLEYRTLRHKISGLRKTMNLFLKKLR